MAKKPRVWTASKSSLRALKEMSIRHSMEKQQLLEMIMLDSRDRHDKLMPQDIIEMELPLSFDGTGFTEVIPKKVVEGEE